MDQKSWRLGVLLSDANKIKQNELKKLNLPKNERETNCQPKRNFCFSCPKEAYDTENEACNKYLPKSYKSVSSDPV